MDLLTLMMEKCLDLLVLNPSDGCSQTPKIRAWMSDLFSIDKFQVSGAIRNGFIDLDDGEVLGLAGVESL